MHFTPTSASWLNLVERWFGIISQQPCRRSFVTIALLERAIANWLENWNENAKPFAWTKTEANGVPLEPDDVSGSWSGR
jgi:hypothetical protein